MTQIDVDAAIRIAEAEEAVEAARREEAYQAAVAAGAHPREWLDTATPEQIRRATIDGSLRHLL